jgi:predicted dehydrogenase
VDRLATAMLQFEKGHAHFSSATQLAPAQFMHIFGTDARITLQSPFSVMPDEKSSFQLDDQTIEFEPKDHYATQGDQFSRAVRGLGELAVPLEDSIANMAVIDAIFRSAETGGWQDVETSHSP